MQAEWRGRPILRETWILAALCALDAVSTVILVRLGLAREANPLLAGALERSDASFLVLKGATFLLPLAALELLRNRNPEFVAKTIRVGLVGYVAIYAVGSLALRA